MRWGWLRLNVTLKEKASVRSGWLGGCTERSSMVVAPSKLRRYRYLCKLGSGRGKQGDFEHTYATIGCSGSGPGELRLDLVVIWSMAPCHR